MMWCPKHSLDDCKLPVQRGSKKPGGIRKAIMDNGSN